MTTDNQNSPVAPQGEYPYLPQSVGDVTDFGDGKVDIDWGHPAPVCGASLYSAEQMRAYVDADRAARAAQPTAVAGPAIKVPEDWMEHLGFELDAPADGVWMVIDDTGARREANLTERILWKELIAIRAAIQDAALAPAAPALEAPVVDLGDLVAVPRDLIGSACAAIVQRRAAPKTLAELRRYTTGDLSRHARAAAPQALATDLTDAYTGAREDLTIWKRRALEAERDLRAEREANARLVAEINAASGPTHMGEAAPQAPAAPVVNLSATWTSADDGLPEHGDLVLCDFGPDYEGGGIQFGYEVLTWDEHHTVAGVARWLKLDRMPENLADHTEIDRLMAAPAVPEDPMDWPLPCDVTVGHVTIRKGCKLRTLVLRMQVLYQLAQETELAAPAAPAEGEVLVEVIGLTGSGKSAICGEIEILCRALGLDVSWPDGDPEKNMTHAEWTAAIEAYKPRVRIVERNVPRQSNGGPAK